MLVYDVKLRADSWLAWIYARETSREREGSVRVAEGAAWGSSCIFGQSSIFLKTRLEQGTAISLGQISCYTADKIRFLT